MDRDATIVIQSLGTREILSVLSVNCRVSTYRRILATSTTALQHKSLKTTLKPLYLAHAFTLISYALNLLISSMLYMKLCLVPGPTHRLYRSFHTRNSVCIGKHPYFSHLISQHKLFYPRNPLLLSNIFPTTSRFCITLSGSFNAESTQIDSMMRPLQVDAKGMHSWIQSHKILAPHCRRKSFQSIPLSNPHSTMFNCLSTNTVVHFIRSRPPHKHAA